MTTAPAKPLTARIEVFRPGTFTPMGGQPITFSAADLSAIADAYDPDTAPAPIVVGHPGTDAPAFGWAESFDYDSKAERLYANVHEIEPAFAALVKAGRFKKVSMQYFAPTQAHNPVPGTWYPKHVGFLGAAAPAVPGLKNIQFSAEPGVTFEASFGTGAETASLLRKVRDLLIEKFGMDDADKALPSWQIEWLDEQDKPQVSPAYAADPPPANPTPIPEKEPDVTKSDPAFATREADIVKREAELAKREAAQNHSDNAAFAESLVQEGKLLPASKDKVVALFDVLPGHAAVSFAEGAEKISPVAALKAILSAQPKIVSFGETDLQDAPGQGKPAAFAADGAAVDPEGLVIHNKALDYQRRHPGTAYMDAVHAVS